MTSNVLLPWINAAGEDGERHSMQSFQGDGTTGPWEFNFAGGYIAPAHVKAYRYNPDDASTHPLTLTLIGPNQAVSDQAIPTGQYIVLYRDTPKDTPLVDYSEGAVLNENNLDMTAQQAVFAAAEMVDRFDAINAGNNETSERSTQALAKADEALKQSGTAITDAAAAAQAASAAGSEVMSAKALAEQAALQAGNVYSMASEAQDNANIAVAVADAAAATADGVDAKATQAQADAAAAVIAANNALASTGDVSHKADINSPTFTGTPSAPTPPVAENSTRLATTHYVQRGYLPLTGGTLTGALATKHTIRIQGGEDANPVLFLQDHEGKNRGHLHWERDDDRINLARYNPDTGATASWLRLNANNTVQTSHAITAPSFNGNATSATKLNTSPTINGTAFNGTANITTARWGAQRALKIGNQSMVVNGSEDVTWTLADIGAAPADAVPGLPEPYGVGSYVLAHSLTEIQPGNAAPGASIREWTFVLNGGSIGLVTSHPQQLAGTWRNMGRYNTQALVWPTSATRAALFMRIA